MVSLWQAHLSFVLLGFVALCALRFTQPWRPWLLPVLVALSFIPVNELPLADALHSELSCLSIWWKSHHFPAFQLGPLPGRLDPRPLLPRFPVELRPMLNSACCCARVSRALPSVDDDSMAISEMVAFLPSRRETSSHTSTTPCRKITTCRRRSKWIKRTSLLTASAQS